MAITLPDDCGNSPRIGIVGEFVTAWATGDPGFRQRLHDDHTWTIHTSDTGLRGDDGGGGAFAPATDGEVLSIVTHGRLASCDGWFDSDGTRMKFSHAIRFASTSKAATIVEIRSYLIRD